MSHAPPPTPLAAPAVALSPFPPPRRPEAFVHPRTESPAAVVSDAGLREALKRCPPSTYDAALRFRAWAIFPKCP